jgi:hypothetical protein
MPDRNDAEVATKVSDLIKEALALADKADLSLVAIHLNGALAAIENEEALRSRYSS